MSGKRYYSIIVISLCSLWNSKAQNFTRGPIVVRTGVILTRGTDLPYDYDLVAPALDAAYERSLAEFNVKFEPINCLYYGGCNLTGAVGETFSCANASVEFIVGPACTDDLMMSLELQTYYKIPSVTGGADLVDSTQKFPYVTRCSYNTFTQWTFFIRMCGRFGWRNIGVLYNTENSVNLVNAQSLIKNLRASGVRPYELPFAGSNVTHTDSAVPFLEEVSKYTRIVVIIVDGAVLRSFMLAAKRLGMTRGDYVFLALDTFRLDVLADKGWRKGDSDDRDALEAFKSLLVLTLRDTSNGEHYAEFGQNVRRVASKRYPNTKVSLNYFVASFYDSVVLYALAVNETVEQGKSIGKDNVDELSQKYWNRTFAGATGMVYINPGGDRSDDHAIYDMTSDGKFYVAAEFYGYKDFQQTNYLFDQIREFNWNNPTNTPPPNEPFCGYTGDSPNCDYSKQTTAIAIGATCGVIFVAIAIGLICYGVGKRRAELAQLDLLGTWKDLTRIQMAVLKSSAQALKFGSHTSLDANSLMHDRDDNEMTTISAQFRGTRVIVRLCEAENVYISRQVLAEIKTARSITNDNILKLQGLCNGPGRVAVMYDYCAKGSLSDLLASESIPLDWLFRFSMIKDIVSGLQSIQSSPLVFHGRLTSACIYVDSHFVAKIADYGLPSFFTRTMPSVLDSNFCATLLWTAPEFLGAPLKSGSQEGDIYSLAIILSETIMREKPYASYGMDPEVIIAKLQKKGSRGFRPRVDANQCPAEITVMLRQCWSNNPLERPRLAQIKSILKESEKSNGEQGTILDTLIRRMENHTFELEKIVEEKSQQFLAEKEKSEQLLYQILPRSVVDQLKKGDQVQPENFDNVTVFYSDIVSFTSLASNSTPSQVVDLLNDLYTTFDSAILKSDAYKVETIGDCWVAASGVPVRNGNKHASEIAKLALTLLDEIEAFKIRHRPEEKLRMRMGAHTGPVVSGVVGLVMPRFCLFGETVTIAGKMESSSKPMSVQVSKNCEQLLLTTGRFVLEAREDVVRINDRVAMQTFWLLKERSD